MASQKENEVIKKKLTDLSENIRRNLLSAATNVTRKFVLEEHDFLAIILLAIQHLHRQTKDDEQMNKKEINDEPDSSEDTKTAMNEGAGEASKDNEIEKMDVEKLRKECLKILASKTFNDEAKSFLLMDEFNRHKLQSTLAKERVIMSEHEKKHPNMMKGGSAVEADHQTAKHTPTLLEENKNKIPSIREEKEKKQKKSLTDEEIKNENENKDISQITLQKPTVTNTSKVWIQDAVEVVMSYMSRRVNKIFTDNLKQHAATLQKFIDNKGTFVKDTNTIHAPRNRFFFKKRFVYFPTKDGKESPPSINLATLLACISFSRSKLFKFLQYRYETVKPFTKTEKQCLAIFLRSCPVSKKRIPCKYIRHLIK